MYHIYKNSKTSKKTYFLRQKCFYQHWLCIYILWLVKKPSSNNWQKTSVNKKPCLFVMYTSALYLLILGNLAFYLLGGLASMHPHEADWTKTGGCYGKARLKEVLLVPPCINNGQHMWSCAHGSWPFTTFDLQSSGGGSRNNLFWLYWAPMCIVMFLSCILF